MGGVTKNTGLLSLERRTVKVNVSLGSEMVSATYFKLNTHFFFKFWTRFITKKLMEPFQVIVSGKVISKMEINGAVTIIIGN